MAVRYGLVPSGLAGGLDAWVSAKKLKAVDLDFLKAKAAHLAGDPPPERRPFLDLASHLSYLTARELLRIGFQVGYQGEDRDYRVASLINHQRLMPVSRIVDLLERLGLPLFFCAHNRSVYYPLKRSDARRAVPCPQCGLQLIPLTSIPALNLSAPPLVDFGGLVFQVVEVAPRAPTSAMPAVAPRSAVPAAVPTPEPAPAPVRPATGIVPAMAKASPAAVRADGKPDGGAVAATGLATSVTRPVPPPVAAKASGVFDERPFDDLDELDVLEPVEVDDDLPPAGVVLDSDAETSAAVEPVPVAEPGEDLSSDEFESLPTEELEVLAVDESPAAEPPSAPADPPLEPVSADEVEALEPVSADEVETLEPVSADEMPEPAPSATQEIAALEPLPSDELDAFDPAADAGFLTAVAPEAEAVPAELAPPPPSPAAPRGGFTRSFVVQNKPVLVEDEEDELPLVEVAADDEPVQALELDLFPGDSGVLAAFNAPPVRRTMTPDEDQLRRLATRYHLVNAESIDQALDLWRPRDPELGQYLVQGGFITGEAHTFLKTRRAEVAAADGLGPIGLHHRQSVIDRAYANGYLNPTEVTALLKARGMPLDGDPLAQLQLLFNHGLLELFQVIDLLEGKGILVWHCPSCMTQIPETDVPIDECPNDGSELVCLTGWGDPADAERPLPEISRLIGAVSPSLSLTPEPVAAEASDEVEEVPEVEEAVLVEEASVAAQFVTAEAAIAAFQQGAHEPSMFDTFDVKPALVFEGERDPDAGPAPAFVFGAGVHTPVLPPVPAPLPSKAGAGKPGAAKPVAGKPGVPAKAGAPAKPGAPASPAPAKPGAPAKPAGRAGAKPAAASVVAVTELAQHYHLLTAAELAEAARQVVPGTTMLDILDRFGYLKPAALGFLRRKLGLDPQTPVGGMGEAAKRYGYTSSIPGPLGVIDGDLPLEVEVPLVAEAYNMGFLPLYQLYDLFDSTLCALEFCSYCQTHYYVPDPHTFQGTCPECESRLEPTTGPRAVAARDRTTPLPRFNRLRIRTFERRDVAASGVMLASGARPGPDDSDEMAAVVAPETVLPEHDALVFTLVEQYLLLSSKELNKAWNKREFFAEPGKIPPLEEFLKADGWLGDKEYQFLKVKNHQLRSGQAGDQTGFSVGELGISKGYLNRGRFVQLMAMEGCPTREDGEAAIAGYLCNNKALQFYQVLDLLECCAVLLMACPDCGDQTQIDDFEADGEYPCPICWQPLLALTIPPGRVPRLMQIPKIEQFRVFRISAHELPEMG